MADRHTLEELNNCSREELITIVLMMQGQLDTLNENIERLIEQVRIANSYRFGKHAETLDSIDGQLSFFDEAESCCDLSVPEPAAEEVLPSRRNHKKKGQREMNLKDFPEEILPPIIIFVFLLLTRFFSHFHFFIEIASKSMSFPLAMNHGYTDV